MQLAAWVRGKFGAQLCENLRTELSRGKECICQRETNL